MKKNYLILLLTLLIAANVHSQEKIQTEILKTILSNFYKNEKIIVKGRNQLLFLFCDKANNNEEIFETVNQLKLPPEENRRIRNFVNSDSKQESWAAETAALFAMDEFSNLKSKVNTCLSLEEYQEKQKRFNLNNQRMMIISKPVFYAKGQLALVKVVFYRSIEHNSGSVLLMEKNPQGGWNIKQQLNPWST